MEKVFFLIILSNCFFFTFQRTIQYNMVFKIYKKNFLSFNLKIFPQTRSKITMKKSYHWMKFQHKKLKLKETKVKIYFKKSVFLNFKTLFKVCMWKVCSWKKPVPINLKSVPKENFNRLQIIHRQLTDFRKKYSSLKNKIKI